MMLKWIRHIEKFIEKCREDNIGAFAAQAAFFLLLSLIPFLMLFISLLQYTTVSEATLLRYVNGLVPEYIAPFVISIINEVYHKSVGIVSVTAITAIWSAAKGVQHISAGLNVIHGVKETRNWLIRRFWAVIYTAVFLISIVAALVLLVFGKSIQGVLAGYFPWIAQATDGFFRLRGLVIPIVMGCVFTVLYRTLPNNKGIENHELTLKNQFPGALLCAAAWSLFSSAISIYLDYFNGFSMYGSLTTIVLVMLWLYFGMYIMMICAEINRLYGELIWKKLLRRPIL